MNPKYPIYIISKGRWEKRYTAKSLDSMGVPYHIVIEPQEYKKYAAVIPREKILKLPFSNLGQGSIPARNWVWEHAVSTGADRHWCIDDNICDFYRFNYNTKIPVKCGGIFAAAENFVDRFKNVALAGFHYFKFAPGRAKRPPFTLNSRIYSCILIKNGLPYRWRGRYNEDTDLSLRALKDGWCTVLFRAFLADKQTTLTAKGGNMEKLYTNVGIKTNSKIISKRLEQEKIVDQEDRENDGRWKMAESLRLQHPDIVTVTRKFGRWQHQVNYRIFRKNMLMPKKSLIVPEGVNNFGMILEKRDEEGIWRKFLPERKRNPNED